MTFPKSLDRGRGTWCIITSWNRTHDGWSPTDKTFCGRGALSLQQPHLNAASQFKVFYYLGSKKKAGVQMGESIPHWLVFYDQGSYRIIHKTPDKETHRRGPVLCEPSCPQGLPEDNVWVLSVCLSTTPLPCFQRK